MDGKSLNKNYLSSLIIVTIIILSGLVPLIKVNAVTYYGDFTTSILLESSGLVRKWMVYSILSNLTLYDDYYGYWDSSSGTLTDNSTIYISGLKSSTLKINSVVIQYIAHDYISAPPDFSMYNQTSFWVYGANTNDTLGLWFESMETTHYYKYNWVDNYTGWRHYIINFDDFIADDGVNWNSVQFVAMFVGTDLHIGYCHNVDNLELLSVSNTYYEVWDGSTLKYQGLIDPDINDFITQSDIITPTNNGWFNFILLMIVFGLALIGIKIPITAFPSIIIGLYLIINYADFAEYQLLYIIIILLSITLDIMDLVHMR